MRLRNFAVWVPVSLVVSLILLAIIVLALITLSTDSLEEFGEIQLKKEANPEEPSEEAYYTEEAYIAAYTVALFRATVGLAAFTFLLFIAAALTAIFALHEFRTSTTISSADLVMRIDDRFHSDRALRIRHGAVTFLKQHGTSFLDKPTTELNWECRHKDLSLYPIYQAIEEFELNSDLIDIFNYYDLIGYLVEVGAIKEDMAWERFGPWVVSYYRACEQEIKDTRRQYPGTWKYLHKYYKRFDKRFKQREKKWVEEHKADYPDGYRREEQTKERIKKFLRREHVRSHRGSTPFERPKPPY